MLVLGVDLGITLGLCVVVFGLLVVLIALFW